MNLTLIKSYIPWSTLQTSYKYFNTWSPVALIVTQIALRWKMMQDIPRLRNSQELQAERYQELVQGLVLLGLAAPAAYWKSGPLLASINLIALGRLYGDLKIVPFVKRLPGQASEVIWNELDKTYFDIGYESLELVFSTNLIAHAFLLNVHDPLQGLLVGAITFVLPGVVAEIFKQMVYNGYWHLSESRLISLKIERTQTYVRSLMGIGIAFVCGLMGWPAKKIHLLGPKRIEIGGFFFLTYSMGCSIYFRSFRQFSLDSWLWASSYLQTAINYRNDTARLIISKLALYLCYGDENIISNIVRDFNSKTLRRDQIQNIFSLIHINLKMSQIIKIVEECPAFTPDFLSTFPMLWENLNNDQIQIHLLTLEIVQHLKEDKVAKTQGELQKLTEEIDKAEKAKETDFSKIKPLREQLEKLSFSQENHFLSRVPISEKPIVVKLNALKTKIQQRENAIAHLEQRLETLCEDVKLAYEGIAQLREEDMKKVLDITEIPTEGQHAKTLFNLLAKYGIKWKGDLIAHEIVKHGNNANTNELLIERLVKFIQDHKV